MQPSTLSRLVSLSFLLSLASATIYENVTDVIGVDFDYVIVGGGAAGSVLANRLSENENVKILVLEAGGRYDTANVEVHVPFWVTKIPGNNFWNYTTVPQAGLNNREVAYGRGFLLGGSTSVNGMFYTRGSSEDLDRFAAVSGEEGWTWDNMRPYFDKSEKWTEPADGHNTTGQYDPSAHSTTGMVSVSLAGYPQGIDNLVFAAGQELGGIFEYNLDQNDGNNLGLSWNQAAIDGANRSSAAYSYLADEYSSRENLYILIHSRVSRVLPTDNNVTFRAVEFAQDLEGPLFTVNASTEVILSAGPIGTPQILLNSGIGNASYLESFGIPALVDLPSVGQNLTDHPSSPNTWFVNSTNTFETLNDSPEAMEEAFEEWSESGTGPLVVTPGSQLAFFRFNDTLYEDSPIGDPSAGPNSPHMEFIIGNGLFVSTPPPGNFISISTNLLNPVSRGSIVLNDVDVGVFSNPLIDPAFFKEEIDLKVMREGIKDAFAFAAASAFDGYILEFNGPLNATFTDDAIDEWIRMTGYTAGHPVGTASMSASDAQYGVVNPDLRVKGVTGLRIVDASIFPFSTSAHPMSIVYAIAERAADLIKEAQ